MKTNQPTTCTTSHKGYCSPELTSILQAHRAFQQQIEAYMFTDDGTCTYRHEDQALGLDEEAHEILSTLITCAGMEVWDNVCK